jgi:hypothetical protein
MVRSINHGPREVVDELPDSLLARYHGVAEEKYGALGQPVVALTNEAMEIILQHDSVRVTEETVETVGSINSLIIDILARETSFSRTEILDHCHQTTLSAYSDSRVDRIQERACTIAEEIDRESLWPRFKRQAYRLHGESDQAVIRHIREAMILVTQGMNLNELRQKVQHQTRMMEGIQRFVEMKTDFELDGCKNIYDLLMSFEKDGISFDQARNASLEDFVDDQE